MNRVRRSGATVAALMLVCNRTGVLRAQDRALALDTGAVERALRDELQRTRTPGASIAVVMDGRLVYAKAIGVSDVETSEPMTTETLVRIGSITKSFTGLTTLLLADRGIVDLDRPIGTYATGLSPALRSLTLRRLLSHTAGLADEGSSNGPHDPSALATRVRRWGQERVLGPPNDIYSYSSPGIWLAGYVIEQAAKGLYPDVVERTLLAPLGMRRSTFAPTMAMTYPMSQDHRLTGDSMRVLRPFTDDATTWPSGSLFSSATELARYASAIVNDGMLDGQRVLPHAVVELLGTNQVHVAPTADASCGYSFGLSVCMRDSVRQLSHYGFRVGSGAVLTMVPDRKFAVVILANRNGAIFRSTEQKVLELALGNRGERRDASRENLKTRPTFAGVAGVYVSGKDTLRLRLENDSLFYEYGREAPQRATIDAAGNVAVLSASGEAVQEFMIVRGRSGQHYLHDGLNGFRKVTPRR